MQNETHVVIFIQAVVDEITREWKHNNNCNISQKYLNHRLHDVACQLVKASFNNGLLNHHHDVQVSVRDSEDDKYSTYQTSEPI
jgi:hypothetical protein